MELDAFFSKLNEIETDEALTDFCRKNLLHGTPFVFSSNDGDYYEFRKKIGDHFNIPFYEIYITGSAKIGFSPFKGKLFDYDSDIDVALVSPSLFDKMMHDICDYQMQFRKNRGAVSERELRKYHEFLEYVAIGWIRPDKLPVSFEMRNIKDQWFEFFRSISNGKSEVGNYIVTAGVFKSYDHLERYTLSGLKSLSYRKKVGKRNGPTN